MGVTTTHAAWGAGRPRLVVVGTRGQVSFPLVEDLVRIGSDSGNEVVLSGTKPEHARIEHDEQDEFVLTMLGPGTTNAVSMSEDARTEILRTGATFTIAGWQLVFMRDEFADHGQPYGGRQGGEGAHQHGQPARPDYHEQHERALREHELEKK